MTGGYNETRIKVSRKKTADDADKRAAARRRIAPLERLIPDGMCPLDGCWKPWRLHAHSERRAHQRLIAAGATRLPDNDDEDDG